MEEESVFENVSYFNTTAMDFFTSTLESYLNESTETQNTTNNTDALTEEQCHPIFPCGVYAIRNGKSPILRGLVGPAVVIPVLILNFFVVVIFSQKDQRTPTTVLLVGLAIFDSLFNIFTYMCEPYNYFQIPGALAKYPACAISTLSLYTSVMFHGCSVYITTTLGFMRYCVVAFPIKSRNILTTKFSCVAMLLIFLFQTFAILVPSYFLFEIFPAGDVDCGCVPEDTCFIQTTKQFKRLNFYYNIMRCIFCQSVPCVMLMFTTGYLVVYLTKDTFSKERHVSEQKQAKKRRTTLMIVAILVLFLIVEIQIAVLLSIRFYEDETKVNILTLEQFHFFVDIINFELLLEVSSNFWIYIFMSEAFRTKILGVLTFRSRRKKKLTTSNTRTTSAGPKFNNIQENEKGTCSTDDTNNSNSESNSQIFTTGNDNVSAIEDAQ